jgi:hypothetical protein
VNLRKQPGYHPAEFTGRVPARLPATQEFKVPELPDDIPVHRTFAPATPLKGRLSR